MCNSEVTDLFRNSAFWRAECQIYRYTALKNVSASHRWSIVRLIRLVNFYKKRMICWNLNYLPGGIQFINFLDSWQSALWNVGMLISPLLSSEVDTLQIALQIGPDGLSGVAPQSQESGWAENASLRQCSMSWLWFVNWEVRKFQLRIQVKLMRSEAKQVLWGYLRPINPRLFPFLFFSVIQIYIFFSFNYVFIYLIKQHL